MKKFKFFLLAITGAAALMLGGCKEKAKYDESAFQDDLEPLTDDELEAMDENTDNEMTVEDESEIDQNQEDLEADETKNKESSSDASADSTESQKKLDEKGTYTDKDDVAEYIYEYGHVPSNLKAEAYDNADNMLPVEDGVTYQQCSLDTEGKQKIIFTQDGKRVYYTADDGGSFEEIY